MRVNWSESRRIRNLDEDSLAALLVRKPAEIREISQFPSIRRDINVVVDESVPARACVEAAYAAAPAILSAIELIAAHCELC